MADENRTALTEFLLLSFSDFPDLRTPLFSGVLAAYLATLLGNALIIRVTLVDRALHSPMYFLLRHLSFLEILYTTDVVPKTLVDLLALRPAISFGGCAAQMFFFIVLGITECCLLTAMAYDRYVAICRPLHYPRLLSRPACLRLVGTSWVLGVLTASTHTSLIFSLPFRGTPTIHHFLCDILPVLRLAGSGRQHSEASVLAATVVFILAPFSLIVASYARIAAAILRLASSSGRRRAFSTCSSHLLAVSLFFLTTSVTYLRPRASSSVATDRVLSLFYTVVTPMLNPVIYTLRNKEVVGALDRMLRKQRPGVGWGGALLALSSRGF
ncbi:olfactory receptor 10P1 [Ornithorhynchus anatinus]|uniref:olfactory receptor 10P1 n=1 Tax=Ornithorhynchus anatinus TaxID=9258 RepID=UPI0010A82E7F|nr:olfactory receptor 10P1 [Ornithorhynchus anatinus]